MMSRSARVFAPVRFALAFVLAALVSVGLAAGRQSKTAPAPANAGPIRTADLERWLTFLSSDQLEGRATLAEGLVRAGDYLAAEARALGMEPGGDSGTFFQDVKVLGVKSENHSTLTVEVNGQARVFKHGDVVSFPKNVGGKRSFTVDQVEFLGYGLNDPAIRHDDFAGKDLKGRAVVWLGPRGPKGSTPFSALVGRAEAVQQAGVAAVINPTAIGLVTGVAAAGRGSTKTPQAPAIDFTTVRHLDDPMPASVAVNADKADAFYTFLFSGSGVKYSDLKAKAVAREPLPSFTLRGVKLTFNLHADYTVVRTQTTRNVVGVIRGTDPMLSDTYVVLGAHYDHLGVGQPPPSAAGAKPPAGAAKPRSKPGAVVDRIFNGADDDGSGSVALLSIAKAFLGGPRPRRTLVFVWFAGEERGLWGSRYHANYGLPSDTIVAMLNLDMIGRKRGNRPEEANKVYPVGSDRISTELHNINVEANASLSTPLTLDYEHNDPADTERLYSRSDHASYASKGIPVIGFTTGMHPDYHRVTDSVGRIDFPKMARIAELVYETARRVANLDHAPVRDNKGPRAGAHTTRRGSSAFTCMARS
jgi:hypothetical protein